MHIGHRDAVPTATTNSTREIPQAWHQKIPTTATSSEHLVGDARMQSSLQASSRRLDLAGDWKRMGRCRGRKSDPGRCWLRQKSRRWLRPFILKNPDRHAGCSPAPLRPGSGLWSGAGWEGNIRPIRWWPGGGEPRGDSRSCLDIGGSCRYRRHFSDRTGGDPVLLVDSDSHLFCEVDSAIRLTAHREHGGAVRP